MPIPKRLKKNQLLDVSAEVRFSSKLPSDAIVGLVYAEIKERFGSPESLPILQVPAALRDADPQLKYQACYKFTAKGHSLSIGPRNVILSTMPYDEWASAAPTLTEVLNVMAKVKLFDIVERIGLRFVNFFEGVNVLEHSTLTLKVGERSIAGDNVTLRDERRDGPFTLITQLINSATIAKPPHKNGSIFDIDVIRDNLGMEGQVATPDVLGKMFLEANSIADELFFGMLKPEFVQRFEPVY